MAGKSGRTSSRRIICTAFDITIAALARFFAGKNYAPTISLDVKFIRPVKVGDRMLVTAKAVATGRRITQLTCEAYSEQTREGGGVGCVSLHECGHDKRASEQRTGSLRSMIENAEQVLA